jgi:hypothetical protein
MDTSTASAPVLAVPPEVLEFAREQKVAEYLPALIELSRQLFPTARRFAIRVEDDPEIANDRHIVFEIDVPLEVPEALEARGQWVRGLFACCPAPLVCVYRLSLNLVS